MREDVPIEKVMELLNISEKVELGIQAHSFAMSYNMPRNVWFNELLNISAAAPKPLNIAIHVNYQWCSDFCHGELAPELLDWFYMTHKNTGQPVIKRWQLNIGDGTAGFDASKLSRIISNNPRREFIFPYNAKKQFETGAISKLNRSGAEFSLLFDASYGAGITPGNWTRPAYKNHPQGYAGGLCGENIAQNLDKIAKVVPKDYETWIDAEGKLMTPGTRRFDADRASDYITQTLKWLKTNHLK
jgi:hypothetical protein